MTKINPEIMLAVSDLYYKGMLNIIIQSPTQKEAEELKQSILQNQEIVERLDETIDWVDSQLSYLSKNDKDRYIDFEWLKSHLLSIKNNENRNELQSILKETK